MDVGDLAVWATFLTWLTSPTAIPVVVGCLLSVIIEYIPKFNGLDPKWKRAAFFGLSVLVPLLGAVLGIWTLGWPATWVHTFWPALVAGGLAFASGTLAHTGRLKAKPDLGRA